MGSVSTWRKVECGYFGPFTVIHDDVVEYRMVVTLFDPFSHWTLADSIQTFSHSDVFGEFAEFLLKHFCLFGFTPCSIINHSNQLFDLQLLLNQLQIKIDTCGWSDLGLPADFITHDSESKTSLELFEELTQFTQDFQVNWHLLLQSWLFRKRIAPVDSDEISPFSIVFQHDPINLDVKAKQETVLIENRRRMIKNPNLQCRHCEEVFTSRISFQIHQKHHLDAARERGKAQGEKAQDKPPKYPQKLTKRESGSEGDEDHDDEVFDVSKRSYRCRRRKGFHAKIIDPSARIAKLSKTPLVTRSITRNAQSDASEVNQVAENTLRAVKALLAATKTERKKRGKYTKFDLEMRDEIAQYALDHGVESACQEYSARFEFAIHASSVRNYIKALETFTPELREQIGRFVYQYGFDRCLNEYNQTRPDLNLNRSLMRQFKRVFLRKYPNLELDIEDDDEDEEEDDEEGHDDQATRLNRPKRLLTVELRDEIGQYAFQHDTYRAVEYYSTKLQFPLREAAVRKLKKAWVAKTSQTQYVVDNSAMNQVQIPRSEHYHHQEQQQQQPQQHVIAVQMPANVIQTTQVVGSDGTTQYVQYPVVVATNPTDFSNPAMSQMQVLQTSQSSNVYGGIQTHPTHMAKTTAVVLGEQSQLSYIADPNSIPLQLTTSAHTTQQPLPGATNGKRMPSSYETPGIASNPMEVVADPAVQPPVQDENVESKKPTKRKYRKRAKIKTRSSTAKKSNLTENTSKRGQYTSYDPQIRASIGKYAVEHGNQQTIDYFHRKHGLDLPESTVRGLRDRYLLQSQKGEAAELKFGPRGRPMRLGKYDEIVRKCIHDLIASGEKMSTFLAIATAKQVLQQNDPSMLIENGGKVNLNPVWAKSFLKRIGVSIRKKKTV